MKGDLKVETDTVEILGELETNFEHDLLNQLNDLVLARLAYGEFNRAPTQKKDVVRCSER